MFWYSFLFLLLYTVYDTIAIQYSLMKPLLGVKYLMQVTVNIGQNLQVSFELFGNQDIMK